MSMSFFGVLAFVLGPVIKFLYEAIHNYGLTIIVFTVLVRVVCFPLGLMSQKTMAKQSVFMPMVQEIQTKYRNDPQKQNEEMQRMKEDYGYSPTSGCLPQLVNMLVLFGVIETIYYPMRHILGIAQDTLKLACEQIGTTYSFKAEPLLIQAVHEGTKITAFSDSEINLIQGFNMDFFGINLCDTPTLALSTVLILPILAVITMIFTNIITMSASGQQLQGSMKYMPWMMSIFFAWFCFTVPVAFSLYYAVSNLLMLAQTMICKKIYNPEKYKAQYAAELEAKKKEKKKKKTVAVTDKKTGEQVVKEVTDNELNKLRLERARALDAERYGEDKAAAAPQTKKKKAEKPAETAPEAAPAEAVAETPAESVPAEAVAEAATEPAVESETAKEGE